jgi:hypothetical protein
MWQNAKTNYRRATSIYDYRRPTPTPTQMKTTPTDDAAHLHDAPTCRTFGTGKESHHGQMTREGGFPRHVALIGEVYGDDVHFYYYYNDVRRCCVGVSAAAAEWRRFWGATSMSILEGGESSRPPLLPPGPSVCPFR